MSHVTPVTQSGESDAAYARRASRRDHAEEIQHRSRVRSIGSSFIMLLLICLIGVGVGVFVYFNSSNAKMSLDDERVPSVLVAPEEGQPYYVLCAAELGTATAPGGAETDAYLLVRVDEAKKMLTFVGIPSNISVTLSDSSKHPLYEARGLGGQSELIAAVSEFAGVDIAHYAETDAAGIKSLAESLGDVTMVLSEEIDDPNASWLYLPAGERTLTPDGVLAVLRADNISGGVAAQAANRATLFMELAKKALSKEGFDFAAELADLAGSIRADWSSSELIDLAGTFRPLDGVTMYASCVPGTDGDASFSVKTADWERLMSFVDAGESPEKAFESEVVNVDRSKVVVEIRNGGGVTGMGAKMGEILEGAGYKIEAIGNVTDATTYPETLVIYSDPEFADAADAIIADSGIGRAVNGGDFYTFETDILVVVGQDWMPTE